MEKLRSLVAGILGATGCLVVNVFFICALPLTVLALMHQFGLVWWKAMLIAVVGACIPVLGQIGYVVLTFTGAYLLFQSGFDWERASEYGDTSAEVEKMTPAQFETYKQTIVYPVFKSRCIADLTKSRNDLNPSRIDAYCDCYVSKLMGGVTFAEMKAYSANPSEEERTIRARKALQATVDCPPI